MYVLYHFPYSQHARRVVALLEEAQLKYELRHVAMDRAEHHGPEYLCVNPNHQVPTLTDGDFTIYESNAILRYLCHKHDLTQWYPSHPQERGRVDQWLDWNQCRLSPAVIELVLNSVFLGDTGDRVAIERGRTQLEELMPILAKTLESERFIAAPRPTIADISVASNLSQLALAGFVPEADSTRRWYADICELKGFRSALPPAMD
jgi:glutathione S-transferase